MSERTPVIRHFTLPNGDRIMSLRESTLRAGIKAAGASLRPAAQKIADGLNDVIEGRYRTAAENPDLRALYMRLHQIEQERMVLMAQVRNLDGEARSINARCNRLERA